MRKRPRVEDKKVDDSQSKEKKPHWTALRRITDIELRCEWADCGFTTTDKEQFLVHVEKHEPHEEIREIDGKSQSFQCCMWECCGFDSQVLAVTRFHINYHAFHTRIKALGTRLLAEQSGLDCHLDYEGRNLLPVLPTQRVCEWHACSFSTKSYQRLIDHAEIHFRGRPQRRPHETVFCEWQDCNREYKNFTQLKSHLVIHTQEKVIGCPVCGAQFANKTKLIDHCMRQVPTEKKRYKCSYCKKSFPSERILRDHIRLHVNLHKCPLCEMTCPYPYTLTLHIRYRHSTARPFKCTFCDHWSTTERDLESHHQSHCSENFWACEQEGCDFSCRSENGLTAHYRKAHAKTISRRFACHICDARYNRGNCLTLHLRKEHSYHWASGYSRFRYIKDESGLFRLQTVRYESIEVTQQIMQDKPGNRYKQNTGNIEFDTTFEAPDKIVIGLKVKSPSKNKRYIQISEDSNEEDVDDVEAPCETRVICTDAATLSGQYDEVSETADEENHENEMKKVKEIDSDSEFSESLQKHLGLTGSGFIEVIKHDVPTI